MIWNGIEKRKTNLNTLEEIKDRLTNIETDVKLIVNKMESNHKNMRDSIDRNYDLTKKHEETLYGNGGDGLTTQLRVLQEVKEDFESHKKNDTKIQLGLFSLLVTILAGMAKLIFFK